MSKILNTKSGLRSSFEMVSSVPQHFSKFDLVVIRPIPGKPGKLVFTATVYAESVTKAVANLRNRVEGSGYLVLQASAFHQMNNNPAIMNALADAYEKRFG